MSLDLKLHQNVISYNKLTEDILDNHSYYTKKNLLHAILFLEIIHPLLNIICDYCYQSKYCAYVYHKSSHWTGSELLYNAMMFENMFIEHVNGTCYITDMLKNQIICTLNENDYVSDKYFFICDNKIHIEKRTRYDIFFGPDIEMCIKNNKIIRVENKNSRVQKIISFTGIDDECFLGLPKITCNGEKNFFENRACEPLNKTVNVGQIRNELVKLLKKSIRFERDQFTIDSQDFLTMVFYVNDNDNPHILEYDINTKQILDYYVIEGFNEDIGSFTTITFEEEYMNVLCRFKSVGIRFKKIVI
jgi:hypothetical protein